VGQVGVCLVGRTADRTELALDRLAPVDDVGRVGFGVPLARSGARHRIGVTGHRLSIVRHRVRVVRRGEHARLAHPVVRAGVGAALPVRPSVVGRLPVGRRGHVVTRRVLAVAGSVAGPGDEIPLPAGKERVDYEAELAVVIGEQARNVAEEEALDYVAGYTCFNDISNRDDQDQEQNWIRGKAFDSSAPMGPVLAAPEELPDDARIQARVNGEVKQDSTLDHLIFPIPELIAEITDLMTLEEGDVIATGTPDGVGPLEDGDRVEIEVEGVGTLEHTVVQ